QTIEDAISAVTEMLSGNKFGEAGHRVVIEEFLIGEEVSFIVISDGKNILPLASSQDHKARDEGDKGPNTGGMGAYSPAPVIDERTNERILEEVIEPTVTGMREDGMPYVGFLYAGLMITAEGAPKVLEFNCRFGDPETQPILFRLKSDLVPLCEKALDGSLNGVIVDWDTRAALAIVLASDGYPANVRKGDVISGTFEIIDDNVKVFHAGTISNNEEILTDGGRVLSITALGETVKLAQISAYKVVEQIHWKGMFFRKDIGFRAIAREERR
ncbi:MAG: phosphoribosylamine--glycine ligase, partial [Gammaproteobacteria bacterium]|nr:phosphoribosylamine--glycine ligase [Gammaproteobacteria bacterium]